METIFGLIQDGKLNPGKRPNLLQMAAILTHHGEEFRLSSPPPPLQAIVFPVLKAIAGLAGYRATYDARPRQHVARSG